MHACKYIQTYALNKHYKDIYQKQSNTKANDGNAVKIKGTLP